MVDRATKRKPNWTDTEQIVMLDMCAKYKDVLGSKETSVLNCHQKSKCWVEITKQLNQTNPRMQRTVEEVKRKWHNLLGQGRRDFFDWKRAQQNPKLPSVNMPAISRRALELHGGFRFEDWQRWVNQPFMETSQDDELLYLDAGNFDMSEERATDENLDLHDTVQSEMITTPAQDDVKQECPSLVIVEDCFEVPAALANTAPPPHQVSTSPPALAHTSNLQLGPPNIPQMQPTPISLHTVQAVHVAVPVTSSNIARISTVSPRLNYGPQITGVHHLAQPAPNVNRPSIVASSSQPPVTMATASYTPSSVADDNPASFLEPASVQSRASYHPQSLEPARKKFRGLESEPSERGAGLHAEREAELRIDILQLEKDKLWLETEKLRLEIDILRKQKQQMNSTF